MENNKILISVHFSEILENTKKERLLELFVLRDATLRQLLDGVRYGLQKEAKTEAKKGITDHSVLSFADCSRIFENVYADKKTVGNDSCWPFLRMSVYDSGVLNQRKEHTVQLDNHKKQTVLFESDLGERLCDLGFVSSTKLIFSEKAIDEVTLARLGTDAVIKAFQPDETKDRKAPGDVRFPQYNISTRRLKNFRRKAVEILPPSSPPQPPQQNLWMMLLPTVLTVAVMVLMRGMMNGTFEGNLMYLFMSAAMGVVSLFTAVMTWTWQKREYRRKRKEWKEQYEGYIARTVREIQERKNEDKDILKETYPPAVQLLEDVRQMKKEIFSRSAAQDDFLTVRLGTSDQVENLFEIKGTEREEVFSPAFYEFVDSSAGTISITLPEGKKKKKQPDDVKAANQHLRPLTSLPADLAQEYRYMKDAPLLYSLRNCGTLGVVYNSAANPKKNGENVEECFVRRMLFDLAYYHSPENLQFVIFFPETREQKKMEDYMHWFTFLPHCRELFADRSQFVFSKEAADDVLGNMLRIMEERSAGQGTGTEMPHIVFVVFHEYNLKEHAFASHLPKAPKEGTPYRNDLGLTCVFVKRYPEYLPEYCSDVITLTANGEGCRICPYADADGGKTFTFKDDSADEVNDVKEAKAFRMLSGIYYTRISQSLQVPSGISLFQQFGIAGGEIPEVNAELCRMIRGNWGTNEDGRIFDVTRTLAVPIGKNTTGDAILDLHERADGPHMLVAGTTGSGKSETILSYLIGLCFRFRPDEVSLMLVDMKGGGFTKRLGTLPHVVGKISDIDGNDSGADAGYMLKRFLTAIKAEVKRRKVIIGHFKNVDSIDGYIRRCREIRGNAKSSAEDLDYIRENPLTHLVLVVDEFTELKRFSAQNGDIDYMGELTTIARIGRSLGIHIVLISQNIEGAITDDIRVNAKSRLCLKVATRQASKEMIGNDLAASPNMPGNGRAYLLVGTGSKFEYFQSAYSGVRSSENSNTDMTLIRAEKERKYTTFYFSAEDNPVLVEKKKENGDTQLTASVRAITAVYEEMESRGEIAPVRKIFRDPLPFNEVYDPAIHRYDEQRRNV